jgi:hypothetical protein
VNAADTWTGTEFAAEQVQEWREEGYVIDCDPVEGQRGVYRYTLRARPVIAPSNVTTAVERWPVLEPEPAVPDGWLF